MKLNALKRLHETIQFYMAVWAGQAIVIAYSVCDSLVVGRFAPDYLGALALANSLYVPTVVTATAVLAGTTMLVARADKDGKTELQIITSASFALAFVLSIVTMIILSYGPEAGYFRDENRFVAMEARKYLFWVSLATVPSMLFRVIASQCNGAGLTRLVTRIQAMSLLVKFSVTYFLMKIGAASVVSICGLSTAIVLLFLGISSMWLLARHPTLRPFRPKLACLSVFTVHFYDLLRVSVPIGISTLTELSAFSFMTLRISHYGVQELSAHQLAANLNNIGYSFIASFSVVTAVRLNEKISRSERSGPDQADMFRYIVCGTALGAVVGTILCVYRGSITAFYTSEETVRHLANNILPYVGLVLAVDAVQSTAATALRARQQNLIPSILQISGLWLGCGVFGGQIPFLRLAATPLLHGAAASWFGMFLGLSFSAVGLCLAVLLTGPWTERKRTNIA